MNNDSIDFALCYPTVDDIMKALQYLGNEALLSKLMLVVYLGTYEFTHINITLYSFTGTENLTLISEYSWE